MELHEQSIPRTGKHRLVQVQPEDHGGNIPHAGKPHHDDVLVVVLQSIPRAGRRRCTYRSDSRCTGEHPRARGDTGQEELEQRYGREAPPARGETPPRELRQTCRSEHPTRHVSRIQAITTQTDGGRNISTHERANKIPRRNVNLWVRSIPARAGEPSHSIKPIPKHPAHAKRMDVLPISRMSPEASRT